MKNHKKHLTMPLHTLATLCVALALTACGGGGPEGDLTVTFDYPFTVEAEVFQPFSLKPTLAGLGGNAPRFTIDRNHYAIPEGLALNGSTGEISGTPTRSGDVGAGIALTVPNYEGRLFSAVTIKVKTPFTLNYGGSALYAIGQPMQPRVPAVVGAKAGDVLHFAVAPLAADAPLPAGMGIDANTGTVSGTPTQAAAERWVRLRMSIQRGSLSTTSDAMWHVGVRAN